MVSRPLAWALVVTALVTAFRMTGTVDSDVAWQLWIAQRIRAGAWLYRDIVEVNPPLWFWMALPVDGLAHLFRLRIEAALVLSIGVVTALSLSATGRLLDHIAPPLRALLLSYAAFMLMAMPWVHVGQREQIVLIGTLPYAALIAARREGRPVPTALAVLIGVGAALGFSLKHYFLVVPALLELWLLAGRGRAWRLLRPEVVALVATGALYGAAILIWARDFLTSTVPLVRLSYGTLGAPSLGYLLRPFALLGLATLAVAAANECLLAKSRAPFASSLLIAASAFALIYFVQFKGWTYHAIPLLGCASIALAASLAESGEPRWPLRLIAPALLILPLLLALGEQRNPSLPNADLQEAVSGLSPGETVGFLAVETAVPWSITLQHRLRYPSRYMGYWMLNAVVANERRGGADPRLTQLGRQIIGDTIVDFRCTPPRRIIAARPRPGERGFDILNFFLRNPQFAELLSHYRVRSRTSVETYDLVAPWPRPAPSRCRPGT
jgi:hypothetical protein